MRSNFVRHLEHQFGETERELGEFRSEYLRCGMTWVMKDKLATHAEKEAEMLREDANTQQKYFSGMHAEFARLLQKFGEIQQEFFNFRKNLEDRDHHQ